MKNEKRPHGKANHLHTEPGNSLFHQPEWKGVRNWSGTWPAPGTIHGLVTLFASFALILLVASCQPEPAFSRIPDSEIEQLFQKTGARGSFVLKSKKTGELRIVNGAMASRGYLPASTFKIASSLIALETGVIKPDTVIPWDRVVRPVESWNQDQRMLEAFQRSTVWFYQILTRRVGEVQMTSMLNKINYGNKSIQGGIDSFWLSGGLRITALEQIDLLEQLESRKLPFSLENQDTVVRMMEKESCPGNVFRGKTGWTTTAEGESLGWYVGWIERRGDLYFYAMNLVSPDQDYPMAKNRAMILEGILERFGLSTHPCSEQR